MYKDPSKSVSLKRPKLLVRAARHRAAGYRRARHLPDLLAGADLGASGMPRQQLLALEDALDQKRRAGAADYDVKRHIDVLSALLSEPEAPERPQSSIQQSSIR